MEPLGVAASVIAVVESASRVQSVLRTALSRSRESDSAQESLRRLDASITMLKVMHLELDPGNLSARLGAEPATDMLRQIGDIHLADLNISLTYPSDMKAQKEYPSHVAASADRLEKAVQQLREIEQIFTLRRIEKIVVKSEALHSKQETENNKRQQAVSEIGQTLSVLKSHLITNEGTSENDTQKALDNIGQRLSEISLLLVEGESPDRTIDELRAALQSTLGRSQGSDHNLVVFPFVILMAEAEDVMARVILDTGVQDNWINAKILERANMEYDELEGAGNYVGAGGAHFTPLGQRIT
ncbi:hypothetical protein CORC01_13536 [Colletotrichum orchidophilum]|uniref:Uncharacterized protein n=1 Tax=Colletotrichum orchidophilum TaxID=1209926 RepID=A0A1G4APP8_9PEZI|nr:uncharacterized protein CORC01_13536 [Colletotrichum orchidophilum]OHE91160.1 hypothetical protein CORC01_13536 [Colletotrichum orchidophilum]